MQHPRANLEKPITLQVLHTYYPCKSSQKLYEVAPTTIPILWMRKLRHKDIK